MPSPSASRTWRSTVCCAKGRRRSSATVRPPRSRRSARTWTTWSSTSELHARPGPDLALDQLSHAIPQQPLVELPDVRARECRHPFQPLRPLELGDAQAGEVLADVVERDRRAPRDHEGTRAFAEPGVRHRDNRGFSDGRVPQQQALDLFGVDLLAAAADYVLDPAVDGQVAPAVVREHRGEVAGAVEAVRGERDGVVLRGVEVARN